MCHYVLVCYSYVLVYYSYVLVCYSYVLVWCLSHHLTCDQAFFLGGEKGAKIQGYREGGYDRRLVTIVPAQLMTTMRQC